MNTHVVSVDRSLLSRDRSAARDADADESCRRRVRGEVTHPDGATALDHTRPCPETVTLRTPPCTTVTTAAGAPCVGRRSVAPPQALTRRGDWRVGGSPRAPRAPTHNHYYNFHIWIYMHQITRTAITISYMTSCSPFSVQLRNREASPISVFPRRSRPTCATSRVNRGVFRARTSLPPRHGAERQRRRMAAGA